MGGVVTVAVRDAGGVSCRLAQTDDIRPFVQSLCFLTGDRTDEAFADLWKYWDSLTEIPLVPQNYGLVFVDRVEQWVGDRQDYTCVDEIPISGICRSLRWSTQPGLTSWSDDHRLFVRAWGACAITHLVLEDEDGTETSVPWEDVPLCKGGPLENLKHLSAWLKDGGGLSAWANHPKQKIFFGSGKELEPKCVRYAPEGWSFRSFPRTCDGFEEFARVLLDRGIVLSKGQALDWDGYLSKTSDDRPGEKNRIQGLVAMHEADTLAAQLESVSAVRRRLHRF